MASLSVLTSLHFSAALRANFRLQPVSNGRSSGGSGSNRERVTRRRKQHQTAAKKCAADASARKSTSVSAMNGSGARGSVRVAGSDCALRYLTAESDWS